MGRVKSDASVLQNLADRNIGHLVLGPPIRSNQPLLNWLHLSIGADDHFSRHSYVAT